MKEQEKLKATVLKLYSAGVKVADIVTQTGVPRSTVYYWIKNGIPKESSTLNLRDYHFLKQKCERQEKIIAILKSAPCAATAPLQERLAAIEQMVNEEYNVNTLCEALDVAKGTYYNHTLRNKRGETKNAQRRRELFPIIEQIYHESNQTYGAGRITVVMRERGIPVAEGTVARIMHENGLFSIRNLLTTTKCTCAATYIKPTLIHSEGFDLVGISSVYCPCLFGVFHILIIVRRNNNQAGAFLFCLPNSFARTNTFRLCFIVLCEDYAVPFFHVTTYCYRIGFQFGVQHTFDRRIKIVHIAMQNHPFHISSKFIFTKIRKNY